MLWSPWMSSQAYGWNLGAQQQYQMQTVIKQVCPLEKWTCRDGLSFIQGRCTSCMPHLDLCYSLSAQFHSHIGAAAAHQTTTGVQVSEKREKITSQIEKLDTVSFTFTPWPKKKTMSGTKSTIKHWKLAIFLCFFFFFNLFLIASYEKRSMCDIY